MSNNHIKFGKIEYPIDVEPTEKNTTAELLDQIGYLESAYAQRNRIAYPILGAHHPVDTHDDLRDIIDIADRIVIDQARKFARWMLDNDYNILDLPESLFSDSIRDKLKIVL